MQEVFKMDAKVVCLWSEHWVPPEPHQENIIWLQVLRPLATTHWALHMTYPDDGFRI